MELIRWEGAQSEGEGSRQDGVREEKGVRGRRRHPRRLVDSESMPMSRPTANAQTMSPLQCERLKRNARSSWFRGLNPSDISQFTHGRPYLLVTKIHSSGSTVGQYRDSVVLNSARARRKE
eukprot:1168622-Rhodomonas_salina.3